MRLKFVCGSIVKSYTLSGEFVVKYKFSLVGGNSLPRTISGGSLTLLSQEETLFEISKEYYVDVTPVVGSPIVGTGETNVTV